MRGLQSAVVVILLAAGFTWGILRLVGNEFAAGNFYPEYSSLRSDPKGAKLLFDSLGRVPAMTVTRNYLPLEYLNGKAAVMLLGLSPKSLDADFLKRAEGLARGGSRVVAAMNFRGDEQFDHRPLADAWHVQLVIDPDTKNQHRLSFSAGPEWTVRERAGTQTALANARGSERSRDRKGAEPTVTALAIERAFGAGTVLLLAESGDFTNESTIAGDRLDPVSAAIGPYARVVFDEQHLGIAESGSVVQLARRFRLLGFALGLVIVGALAIWKNASAFPPPSATLGPAQPTGRTSFEGLVTLLKRHVRPKDVVEMCWEEWWKANSREIAPGRAARAAQVAAQASDNPLQAMREIQAGLALPPAGRAKGEL